MDREDVLYINLNLSERNIYHTKMNLFYHNENEDNLIALNKKDVTKILL